jgi:hypothetical protein
MGVNSIREAIWKPAGSSVFPMSQIEGAPMTTKMLVRAAILATLVSTAPARADGFAEREIAFQALNLLDAAQTVSCLNRNVCREGNPLFGSNPSTGKVMGIKAGFGVLHYVVARFIHDRDPGAAKIFQIATIAIQGGVVAANLRFGL